MSQRIAYDQVRHVLPQQRQVARSRGQAIEYALEREHRPSLTYPEQRAQAWRMGAGAVTSVAGETQADANAATAQPNTSVYAATAVQVATGAGTYVNLRSSAGLTNSVLAVEQNGTVLTVVGKQQNGWLNVQDPSGVTGWVYSAYVVDASYTQVASSTPSILGPLGASSSDLMTAGLMVGGVVVLWYMFK